MGEDGRCFPKKDTQAYRLLELVAVCGELPAELIYRLTGSTSYKETVTWLLKKEKLLRVYYRDKMRGYRLGRRAKAVLLSDNPERFSFYLTGNVDTNLLKSEVTRRIRLHRIAEVHVAMQNAGVAVFRDEKPKVFAPDMPYCGKLEGTAFYSSREVKELGIEAVKIKGSRMAGVLLAPGSAFLTYNSGPYMAKWDYRAEQRTKALMQIVLCGGSAGLGYAPDRICGLMFGNGMEPFYQIISSADSSARCFFLLDGNYEHFYYLTNDRRGEVMLKLLCDTDGREELDRILSQGLNAGEPCGIIENDAVDKNGAPVLFGYLPDIPRIHRFCNALQLQGRYGTLICFDFQREVLERCYEGLVAFETISFEKFERRFYP
ncbi:MAG: hypothetical protein HDQ98_12240 [Lachnospiraceae bacterium]|nr:hypothetical protein [Lachnospiraceae bacterium]